MGSENSNSCLFGLIIYFLIELSLIVVRSGNTVNICLVSNKMCISFIGPVTSGYLLSSTAYFWITLNISICYGV